MYSVFSDIESNTSDSFVTHGAIVVVLIDRMIDTDVFFVQASNASPRSEYFNAGNSWCRSHRQKK